MVKLLVVVLRLDSLSDYGLSLQAILWNKNQ